MRTDAPLPRIDDLLQTAKHNQYVSAIDFKAGYHQVNVAVADRDKTTFTCPFGTYRFIPMRHQLSKDLLIDNFKNGLKDVTILSYLEDIIIFSQTFEEHLEDLRKVFQILKQYKLQTDIDKYHFACSKSFGTLHNSKWYRSRS
ncbi:hypothetical protein AVEN_240953-1 [Araneus ventricosus]|uniref:Reverse transcriptase domain-containing protein n=1 Tax=Araneus ventricosus TaxID=182803 RepID=A0A4Y2SLU0_ARAVE|nr:hypothetical protein AVEN_240953-1 [Araneus ventricosus]